MGQYPGKTLLLILTVCVVLPVFFGEASINNIDYDECKNQTACSNAIQGVIITFKDTNCVICWQVEIARFFKKSIKLAVVLVSLLYLLPFLLQSFRVIQRFIFVPLSLITLKIRLNP